VRLRAFGSSMLPSLWPGDVLTIEGISCQAPVAGDIVLILQNQRPLVHRVKEKRDCDGCLQWITRGDAVPQSDPPVADAELLGRVSFIQRNRRIIVPRRRLSAGVRALAWMLCHWNRFRSVCLRMHSFLQSPDYQAQEEIR
jgi:signal peptidase I